MRALLYTAKGAGALLVPIAAVIAKSRGWGTVFTIAMTFNLIAAFLALVVLKPMRARHFAVANAGPTTLTAGTAGTRTTS